jgi:hypothetical protein
MKMKKTHRGKPVIDATEDLTVAYFLDGDDVKVRLADGQVAPVRFSSKKLRDEYVQRLRETPTISTLKVPKKGR